MSRSRNFICLCMDITRNDLAQAVDEGFDEPELLKRYTACFMGPCQGKSCMDAIMAELQVLTKSNSPSRRPSIRPPAQPVRLRTLGADDA